MKKGFTLSEIMIALVVIGVITSILLPVAFNNVPNENVMKFKKGNATLAKVVNELVTSGEYYKEGDLGVKADGSLVDSSTYFCKTFAEFVTIKNLNCSSNNTNAEIMGIEQFATDGYTNYPIENFKRNVDTKCKENAQKIGAEIITNDNVIYYQTAPNIHFGIYWDESWKIGRNESELPLSPAIHVRLFGGFHSTKEGFDRIYKIFCMDVDGINQGEEPFGYGIRADGKIVSGARADEWLEKSIQDKE